ncbi:DUF4386 domain-containing protein [Hymenobacter sp. BT664]|uniref:DUF4386 domain-containing protein n=1 Tax=Hymenobacter montanus TaxID=2771359 RepID=A0A927BGI5_9BACT|nr:DUF4386 domain-containing protein [Hymenobacter montanus]MBD2770481.1 DUF4386 domain-containing protein [Hymenobacter montanus]
MLADIQTNRISLSKAAIISGISLLIMVVAALFAEMYAYPKIIVRGDIRETITTLSGNKSLFAACILCYLVTFILDIVVAWSLYILLKPVNSSLSLLTSWFRIVYTILALIALQNLVGAYRLLHFSSVFTIPDENVSFQMAQYLNAFKSQWYFGLLFFSLHLGLLGYLVIKSTYIPKLLGILLIITGIGYSLTTLKPFLFSNANIDFASFTFYGELVFMIWLLIRGRKIKPA